LSNRRIRRMLSKTKKKVGTSADVDPVGAAVTTGEGVFRKRLSVGRGIKEKLKAIPSTGGVIIRKRTFGGGSKGSKAKGGPKNKCTANLDRGCSPDSRVGGKGSAA